MKTNLFSKIKTFFQNQIAKVIPSMTKENTTTDSHGWSRIWNQEFFRIIRRGMLHGFGFMLGIFGTGLLLAVPSGVSSPWASGDKLTAAGLNALRTAIESIPNWTKNGTSAYYTDGNVGIGTATPSQTLQIHNNSQPIIQMTSATGNLMIGVNDANAYINSVTTSPLEFYVNGIERMRITSNGNVGIGTTSPSSKFQVLDGNGGISLVPSNTSQNKIEMYSPIQPNFKTIFSSTANNIEGTTDWMGISQAPLAVGGILFGTANGSGSMTTLPTASAQMVIRTNGYVGIGTTSPSVSLHVAGNACTTGTGMTACASDRRFKTNIKPIENALDLILKIKPVHFTWNQLSEKEFGYKSGTKDIGVIAQEIEKINPDWVKTIKSDYKMVKDSFTKWYTIKAIQELNEKVIQENSSLNLRYSSLIDEQVSLKKQNEKLALRLGSMTENLRVVTETNTKLEIQLLELKKENREYKDRSISFEERLKALEENRYAKK
ncbi:MAG: tail fiber domain-containing protein [Leptospiraceae bacterium]|nr:tail fiber domain-containing protein [Leptospiraceae bacterium]